MANTIPTHFVQGSTARKEGAETFWFAVASSEADAAAAAKAFQDGFLAFLAAKNILPDRVNRYRIEAAALPKEEYEANGALIAALADLTPEQKFNNFLTYVGKRSFEQRFKQRKK